MVVPFACPRCGAVSHDPNDAAHRYCGRCHAFVENAMICEACHGEGFVRGRDPKSPGLTMSPCLECILTLATTGDEHD